MTGHSDEILSAYIDGETDVAVTAEIDKALQTDASLAARMQALRGNDALLRDAFNETLAAKPFTLQEPELPNVVPFRKRTTPTMHRPLWGTLAACLAFLLIGGAGGYFLRGAPSSAPFADNGNGPVVASNDLARALSRARGGVSEPIAGGTMRVVLSFKSASGFPCRQFEIARGELGWSAIACHRGGTWNIAAVVAKGGGETPFQTAAGPDEALSKVADDLGFREPMDSDDEAHAIAAGWN
jgi:hypothetical protein